MNELTQNMQVRTQISLAPLTVDFSDTLIARHRRQSYRTSRDDGTSSPETLEEKVARIKREMEEIRVELAKKVGDNADSVELEDWDKLVRSLNRDENATSLLTSRVKKLPVALSASTALTVSLQMEITLIESLQRRTHCRTLPKKPPT